MVRIAFLPFGRTWSDERDEAVLRGRNPQKIYTCTQRNAGECDGKVFSIFMFLQLLGLGWDFLDIRISTPMGLSPL